MQTIEHELAEELIRDCDIAMYQAKAGGKGRVTVLDQQARAEARDKLRLIADLRDAIERDEIMYYQPIFGIDDREPVAVESLARWNHPRPRPDQPRRLHPARRGERADHVPRAARARGILPSAGEWDHLLGHAVVRRANVNVSALQLDDNLHHQVAAALERHGLDASRISIEITESALMKDPSRRGRSCSGCATSASSSPSTLRHGLLVAGLPAAPAVDCLKVDRSFVAELADGHAEIASAVIALARNLNLCTVAEGVETAEQAEELARLGANFLQGFSLAKPMTGGHIAAWYASRGENS